MVESAGSGKVSAMGTTCSEEARCTAGAEKETGSFLGERTEAAGGWSALLLPQRLLQL